MTTQNVLGAAVIGCVVLGAGWTIYSNIFAASVYPTVGSSGYDESSAGGNDFCSPGSEWVCFGVYFM